MERICMCFFYLCLFFLVQILQKKAYKTMRTPLTFFPLLWCVVGFFANTSIMDYEAPSFFVNMCIIIGILVFTIVYIYRVPRTRALIKSDWEFGKFDVINYRNIIFVNLICWLFMIPRFTRAVQILTGEGFAFLRANLSNSEVGLSRGGISDIVFGYMVEPVFITTCILACFLLFNKQKDKKKYVLFIYSMVAIITYAFTGAARGCLVKFVFCFFFVLMICRKNIIRNLFRVKLVRYSMIVLFAIVLFITFQRGTFGEESSIINSIFRTFYVYYFSGPSYMTKLMEAQPQYGGVGQLLYGSATFGFITNFLSWILIFLTGIRQGSLYILGSVISNTYYEVAPSVIINAMYTCFYTFWIDWGYFGIVLGPAILAWISAYLFKRVYFENDYRSCVIYVFWLYILTRTIFKLDTIDVGLTVVFVCMQIFVTRRRKYIDEKR